MLAEYPLAMRCLSVKYRSHRNYIKIVLWITAVTNSKYEVVSDSILTAGLHNMAQLVHGNCRTDFCSVVTTTKYLNTIKLLPFSQLPII